MPGIAPSAEVQPTIVLCILVVEDNQKTFRTTVLGGMDCQIHIGGCELLVEHTSDINGRGVRLAERAIVELPTAIACSPLARHEVLD